MKKIWVDETDVRTYLAKIVEPGWETPNAQDTINIIRREFCKNLAHDSGFWWMDLHGGWYDSEILMNEIEYLTELNDRIRKTPHRSISDILIIVDEACINHMRVNGEVRKGFMEDFICESNMSGALVDVYRLSDLEGLNISQYKLVVFAYCFKIYEKMRNCIKNKISRGTTVMYNYAAGGLSDSFSMDNIRDITGFNVYQTGKTDFNGKVPRLAVSEVNDAEVLEKNSNGEIVVALKEESDIINIINLVRYIKSEKIREIAQMAGCKFYTEKSGITVYGDNRLIGIYIGGIDRSAVMCGFVTMLEKLNTNPKMTAFI